MIIVVWLWLSGQHSGCQIDQYSPGLAERIQFQFFSFEIYSGKQLFEKGRIGLVYIFFRLCSVGFLVIGIFLIFQEGK